MLDLDVSRCLNNTTGTYQDIRDRLCPKKGCTGANDPTRSDNDLLIVCSLTSELGFNFAVAVVRFRRADILKHHQHTKFACCTGVVYHELLYKSILRINLKPLLCIFKINKINQQLLCHGIIEMCDVLMHEPL
jgi:hypothetical protein